MRIRPGFFLLLVMFVLLFCLPFTVGAASEESRNLFQRGQFEYQDENYRAALEFLDKALALDPDNLDYLYYRGLTLSRLKRYSEALSILKRVQAEDPARKATVIDIAGVYSAMGDHRGAINAYGRAIHAFPERPDLYLSRGLAQMSMKNFGQAEVDIKRAGAMAPSLKATVLYHLAIVSYNKEDLVQAKERLEQTLAANPDDALIDGAKEFIKVIDNEQLMRHKKFSLIVSAAGTYDDNVNNEPLEEAAGAASTGASGRADYSATVSIQGTYKFINRRAWEVGLTDTVFSVSYDKFHENNVMGNTLLAYYSRYIKSFYFRTEFGVSYYLADQKPKMLGYALSQSMTYSLNPESRIDLAIGINYQDMKDDLSPDTILMTGRANFYHDINYSGGKKLTFRAGPALLLYDPKEGISPDFNILEFNAGITFPKVFGIETDLSVTHSYTKYSPNSDVFDDRQDYKWNYVARLSRYLTDNVQIMFLWTHTHNKSTELDPTGAFDPYEFYRNAYSLNLTATF